MTYKDLEGKVAIVTGIGQMGDPNMWGNGAAAAKVLACENGVKVFGCDLYLDAAEHTKKRVEAEGGVCEVMAADVTKSEDVKKVIAACLEKFGRIDLLVNNVGRSEPGGPVELDEAAWDRQTNVNLKSVYLLCHEVLDIMEKQGGGAIVNNASVAGIRYSGKPQVGYAATKAAVIGFTKHAGILYAPRKVRINSVSPGLMYTPLVGYLSEKYANGDLEGLLAKRHRQVPTGYMGDAFDVANAMVFLLSEKARYIIGTNLVVDGGLSSTVPPMV